MEIKTRQADGKPLTITIEYPILDSFIFAAITILVVFFLSFLSIGMKLVDGLCVCGNPGGGAML